MQLSKLLANPNYPKKSVIEQLIMYKTTLTKEQLFTQDSYTLTTEDIARIDHSYTAITQNHRPIEYVLWYCEFSWQRFDVTESTLIPRPETEYMIEAVKERIIKRIASSKSHKSISLLDVGTWCGVLWLSTVLLNGQHISNAILTDISIDALNVAKSNYERFVREWTFPNWIPHIDFVECSLLNHKIIKKVYELSTDHLIVANLPYIPDWLFEENTDPSVHNREPKIAFVWWDDWMDLYRILLNQIVDLVHFWRSSQLQVSGSTTMFLEMMTWQVEILRSEFGKQFEFEEVKTFHFNIRIVKATIK